MVWEGSFGQPRIDGALVDRFEAIADSMMDRVLGMVDIHSPDPRLPYQRYRLLSWLLHHGPLTVGEFAAKFGIAKTTTSEFIARLSADGLVHKREGESDSRTVFVEISPVGQRLVRRRRKQLRTAYAAILHQVDASERDAFFSALDLIDRSIRKAIRRRPPLAHASKPHK